MLVGEEKSEEAVILGNSPVDGDSEAVGESAPAVDNIDSDPNVDGNNTLALFPGPTQVGLGGPGSDLVIANGKEIGVASCGRTLGGGCNVYHDGALERKAPPRWMESRSIRTNSKGDAVPGAPSTSKLPYLGGGARITLG